MAPFYMKIVGTTWTVSQRIVQSLDETATIRSVAPSIAMKLSLPSLQGHKVFVCDGAIDPLPTREIDIDKPIKAQGVASMAYFYFAPDNAIPAGVTLLSPVARAAAAPAAAAAAPAVTTTSSSSKVPAAVPVAPATAPPAVDEAVKKRAEEQAAAAAAAAAANKKAQEDAAAKKKAEEEAAAVAAKKRADDELAAVAQKKADSEALAAAFKKRADEEAAFAAAAAAKKKAEDEAAAVAKNRVEEAARQQQQQQQQQQEKLTMQKAEQIAAAATPTPVKPAIASADQTPIPGPASAASAGNNSNVSANIIGTPTVASVASGRYGFAWDLIQKRQKHKRAAGDTSSASAATAAEDDAADGDLVNFSRGMALARSRLGALPYRSNSGHHHVSAIDEIDKIAVAAELSLAMRLHREEALARASPPRTTLISAVDDAELKSVIAEVATATVERSAERMSQQLRAHRAQEDDDAQRKLLEERLRQHQKNIEMQLRQLSEEREHKEQEEAMRREREKKEALDRERARPPPATHDDLVALQARIDVLLKAQENLTQTVALQRAETKQIQQHFDEKATQQAREHEEQLAAAVDRAAREAAAAAAKHVAAAVAANSVSPAVGVLAASPSMNRMALVPNQPTHQASSASSRPRSPVVSSSSTGSFRNTSPPATNSAAAHHFADHLASISPVPPENRVPVSSVSSYRMGGGGAPEPAPATSIPAPTPQSRLDQRRAQQQAQEQHQLQNQRFSAVSDPMQNELDTVLQLSRKNSNNNNSNNRSGTFDDELDAGKRMTHFVPNNQSGGDINNLYATSSLPTTTTNQQIPVVNRRTAAAARRGHIRVPRGSSERSQSGSDHQQQQQQQGGTNNKNNSVAPAAAALIHTVNVSYTAPLRRGGRSNEYSTPAEMQQSDLSQLNTAPAPITMADAMGALSQGAHQLLVSDRRAIKDWLLRASRPVNNNNNNNNNTLSSSATLSIASTIVPDVAITLVCNSPQFIRSIIVPLMIDQISAAIDRRGNVVGSDGNKQKFSQLLSAVAGLGRVASGCYPVLRTWAKLGADNADKALLALALRATGGMLAVTDAIATLKSEGASAPARNIAAYALGLLAADGTASPPFRRTRVFVFDSPVLEDAAIAAQRAGANGVLSLVQLDKPQPVSAADHSSNSRTAHHKLPKFVRTCILMSRQAALRRALEFLSSPQAVPDYDDDAIDAANWMIPPVAPQLLIEQHVDSAKQLAESLQMTALGLPSWLDTSAATGSTAALADAGAQVFDGTYEQLSRETTAGQSDPQMLPLRDVGLHLISLLEGSDSDSSGSVQELSLLALPKLPKEARAMILEPLLRIFPNLMHAHGDAHPRVIAAAATAIGDAVAVVGASAHPTLCEDATGLLCSLISPTNDVTVVTASCEALACMATCISDETPASRIFWAWERHHLITADSVASCMIALRATQLIAQHILYCVSAVANHGGERGTLHRCTALVDAVAEHLTFEAISPTIANSFVEGFLGALRMLPTETAFCMASVRGLARIGINPGAVMCDRLDEAVTVAKTAPPLAYWDELETVLESDLYAAPVKVAVVESLVKEGGAAGEVKVTRLMLRHAFPWLRAASAKALRHSTGTPVVALLLAANDTDATVREAALSTVESLTQERVAQALATVQRERVKAVAQCCRDFLQFGAAETVALILQVCESIIETEPRQ